MSKRMQITPEESAQLARDHLSPDHPGWYIAERSECYRNPDTGDVVEIRMVDDDKDGHSLDEVCARAIHIEQMDRNHWWMDIGGVHLNFYARGKIDVQVEPCGSADMERIDQATVDRWAAETRAKNEARLELFRR